MKYEVDLILNVHRYKYKKYKKYKMIKNIEECVFIYNKKLQKNISIRKLRNTDYENYISLLSQLTNVGNITKEMFIEKIKEIEQNKYLHLYVISDDINNKLIASGTLYVEPKFIHECSRLGHIEDIVVNSNYRGKKYGNLIIDLLVNIAKIVKCYKITLVCSKKNIAFYNKCNFIQEGYEMVSRL